MISWKYVHEHISRPKAQSHVLDVVKHSHRITLKPSIALSSIEPPLTTSVKLQESVKPVRNNTVMKRE